MIVIHKQVFGEFDYLDIIVPIGSRLLEIAEQEDGKLSCWYERPPVSNGKAKISLFVVPTGIHSSVDNKAEYFKTILMRNGMVWHIYVRYS